MLACELGGPVQNDFRRRGDCGKQGECAAGPGGGEGQSSSRLAPQVARRKRAEAKLKRDKEEAEGKKKSGSRDLLRRRDRPIDGG